MNTLLSSRLLLGLLLSTSSLVLTACGATVEAGGPEQASGEVAVAQSDQGLVAAPSEARLSATPQSAENQRLQRQVDELRAQRRQLREERQERARLAREAESDRAQEGLPGESEQVTPGPDVEVPGEATQGPAAQP